MQGLLEEFVELARSALVSPTIKAEPVPVESILDVARPQLHTLASAHDLQVQLARELPPVVADPQRIAQVLVNLVKNSVYYSPPKTAILIRAQPAEARVQVEVVDHGPGIPPDARTVIFEPFRQLQDGAASRQGLGLGLAIAKSIVEMHGGKIWADDHDRPGARICFTLPAYQPAMLDSTGMA